MEIICADAQVGGDTMKTGTIEYHVRELIKLLGDDPDRSGLKETPDRVARAYGELFSGYNEDPDKFFKIFPDEITGNKGLVVEKNISFHSTCEHHMLPFSGVAHFGYVPKNNRLIGASKIVRLVNCFARRLQIQEKMGQQITDCFMENMKPEGCILVLSAKHHCMTSRGVKQSDTDFITSHIAGIFDEHAIRSEFFRIINLSTK